MSMSNQARLLAVDAFESMRRRGVERLRVVCHWHDDEGHIDDDIEIWEAGSDKPSIWDVDDIDGLDNLIWNIDEYGIFELNATTYTIAKVGKAWMPEPVLEKKYFDTPSDIEVIDPNAPTLPLVEYFDAMAVTDAAAILWESFSRTPTYREQKWPNKVKIEKAFLGFASGTYVDDIVKWFNMAAPGRFSVAYNK